MWNDLSAAIVTMVQSSSEVDSDAVFDYAKSGMDHYPTITVTGASNQESYFADTVRVGRDYNFNIDIFQERVEQGSDDSERILRTIVDSLISIFDGDVYLGGVLQGRGYAKPFNGEWGYTGEQNNTRSARIVIACQVIQ